MSEFKIKDKIMMVTRTPCYNAFSSVGGTQIGSTGFVLAVKAERQEVVIALDAHHGWDQYVHPADIKKITEEEYQWRLRASAIQAKSKPPVWDNEDFWTARSHIYIDHYIHQSIGDRSMLAYFQNPEKAARGIATQIKPGRYLRTYFGSILSEKEIAKYASRQTLGVIENKYSTMELKFANTSEEIIEVYQRGPNSCMSGHNSVGVYGAGDLAVAYLEGEQKILARALCWPEKKIYSRVYPTPETYLADGFKSSKDAALCQSALATKLHNLGFSSDKEDKDGLSGARLFMTESLRENHYVMPYIDHNYRVLKGSNQFFISKNKGIPAQSTNGLMEIEEIACYRCRTATAIQLMRRVATSMNDDGRVVNLEFWCDNCRNEHSFPCSGTGYNVTDNIDRIVYNGGEYAQPWANRNFTTSDLSGERIFVRDITRLANGQVWSRSEFRIHGFICRLSKGAFPKTDEHPEYPRLHKSITMEDIKAAQKSGRLPTPLYR